LNKLGDEVFICAPQLPPIEAAVIRYTFL